MSASDFIDDDFPEELLRLKPNEPSPSDCCGSGCSLCVFDIYEQEMKIWKKDCANYFQKDKQLNKEKYNNIEKVLHQEEYTKFTLENVMQETINSNIYRFNIPNNRKLEIKIGQHLILREKSDERWITRQYTPIASLNTEGYFDVLIKLYEHGKMSKCIRKWKIGDEIYWRGPFGEFQYQPNSIQ